MSDFRTKFRLGAFLTVFLFVLFSMSAAWADQVSLAYVDAGGDAQTLTVDANSSSADLALAAALLGENGVGVTHNPNAGSGSLADIAGAMAAAAPAFAASIAEVLAGLSPEDTDAIVAAILAVPGVNSNAVLAAVKFGQAGTNVGPQTIGSDSQISLELMQSESVPSKN